MSGRGHPAVPAEVRILKLAEEVGEAEEAFIGLNGYFSELPERDQPEPRRSARRRHHHGSRRDDGRCDRRGVGEARRHLEQRLAKVTSRAGL
jgi:hypothetical protein